MIDEGEPGDHEVRGENECDKSPREHAGKGTARGGFADTGRAFSDNTGGAVARAKDEHA